MYRIHFWLDEKQKPETLKNILFTASFCNVVLSVMVST